MGKRYAHHVLTLKRIPVLEELESRYLICILLAIYFQMLLNVQIPVSVNKQNKTARHRKRPLAALDISTPAPQKSH